MKKTLLIAFAGLIAHVGFSQTNFNGNDCAGNNHDFFTEMNNGKVIVLTWVMPCAACIGVASTAANTVLGYATSNPGRVKYYLVDDYANSTCSTLNSWASTNSITTDANFSDALINMTDYGTAGMQKTIVMGGANHTVFYNVVGAVTANALQTAINSALLAVGVAEKNNVRMDLNVYPNPVANSAMLHYNLNKSTEVSIEVFNMIGERVSNVSLGNQNAGKQEYQLNIKALNAGVYFVKLNAGETSETIRFTVTQ